MTEDDEFDVEPYPFDFDKYGRGDVVAADLLREKFPGLDEDQFRLKMLTVRDLMQKYYEDTRGDSWICLPRKDGIHILTHDEHFYHTERRQFYSLRHYAKNYAADLHLDGSKLSTDAMREHRDRRLLNSSWLIQQMRKPKRMEPPDIEEPEDKDTS